ncbi:hypothetical protein BDN72DRAFT_851302 [Pluteus cervinus]|uniref:Uncharacterized protein n=1 Tax=Pluteus cervinus TaxID=181527 RepID=A0ACD3A170_9AGAR|nr:hypothetical protein BDN72DRAFT_851302 [Pluteus cervinus]
MDSERLVVELARNKIDAEIAVLKEHIRALHTRRNCLASISRFPPDVITRIFGWFQQLYNNSGRFCPTHENFLSLSPSLSQEYLPRHYPKWTIVTHVCQHWRQIALSPKSKRLWDIVSFTPPAYGAEAFNRLGSQVPFYLIQSGYSDPTLWTSIARECHRIRFICNSGSHLVDFDKPMPLLEHVKIATCTLSPCIISPSLQTLMLSRCDFTWEWPALPHITALEIVDPVQKVSFDSFLVILFGSPQLKHLTIENLSPADSQPHDLKPVIPSPLLPRLSHLRTRKWQFSADLLTHLRFTDDFEIQLEAGRITADSVPLIMQALNRILLESSKTITCVRLGTGSEGCTINLIDNSWYHISVALDPQHHGEQNLSSCAKYLSVLPLDKLEALNCGSNIFDDPVLWMESGVGQLSSLRRVIVGLGSQSFLEYIANDYEEYKKSRGQRRLSFTSLQSVELRRVHFTRELKNSVCNALAGRDRAGYRLKKFVAESSTGEMVKAAEKQLQKYVDHVGVYPVGGSRFYGACRR